MGSERQRYRVVVVEKVKQRIRETEMQRVGEAELQRFGGAKRQRSRGTERQRQRPRKTKWGGLNGKTEWWKGKEAEKLLN